MYIMKLFKPAKHYSVDEIRDGIKLGKFESECYVSGESDLLIMLPDCKLILSIEIKRHIEFECQTRKQNKTERNSRQNMKRKDRT